MPGPISPCSNSITKMPCGLGASSRETHDRASVIAIGMQVEQPSRPEGRGELLDEGRVAALAHVRHGEEQR